jgi:F-type H+-transporting ATPase subunit a
MSNFLIYSPLDQFEVLSLLSFSSEILGIFNLSITNYALYVLYTITVVLSIHILGDNEFNLVPNKWAIALESSFATLSNIVRGQIGNNNEIFLPFIYAIFWYVIIANLISNIPYSFAVNASAITCLGFSSMIWIGVTILALTLHKVKFFSFFVPNGTPLILVPLLVIIELISYLARAISLGVRLFANLTAGHSLLGILSGFLYKLFTSNLLIGIVTLIPFALFIALTGLEIAVSIIQAYVLTLLVCSYLKDAIDLH